MIALAAAAAVGAASPEAVVRRFEVEAPMGHIDDLKSVLAPDIRVFEYPGRLESRGRDALMRQWRATTTWPAGPMFPDRTSAVIVVGDKVIHEFRRGETGHVAAIYTVRAGKIERIEYVRPESVH